MATFYVTPTGSDSNNGTSISTSKLTINGAIQAISSVSYGNGWDQNTVKVYSSASGPATYYGKHATYNSNIINTSQGNKYGTTVIASGPHDVILDCSSKTRGAYLTYYSHISGFNFTASKPSEKTTDSTVESVYSNTQTRIDNCTFDNCTDTDSVCVSPGGDNSRSSRYSSWVKRCTFKNLDCTSALYGRLNDVSVWESILIYDSTFDFEAVWYFGHSTNYGILRHITIDGCTMGRNAIRSSTADIQNCIVSNCAITNTSYRFYDVLNGAEVDNCLAYNNTTTSGSFFNSADTRNNCLTPPAGPKFTDRSGKDFTLAADSPAKYAGLQPSVGSLGTGAGDVFDLNSASFHASTPSMGCYKFTVVEEEEEAITVAFTMRGGVFNFKGDSNSFTIKG